MPLDFEFLRCRRCADFRDRIWNKDLSFRGAKCTAPNDGASHMRRMDQDFALVVLFTTNVEN